MRQLNGTYVHYSLQYLRCENDSLSSDLRLSTNGWCYSIPYTYSTPSRAHLLTPTR